MTSALLAAALPGTSALAAAPAKAPAQAPANKAEVQDAMLYLKVLISGLQSDKVEQPVKGALVGCLYNNSLGQITESMDKVIAENPGKIHKDNPSELLGVMVRICGYNPQAAASSNPAKGR
ncbi:hypothetical protein [Novosphingobium album (ex Hu et al. 2023)]|uniref:Uncharacterized protein n=1 Tax=Novosphingobium album (ex Hu et al. 2023) TaxID=2930093 RepID=A0ABT0AYI4_9SPHN|nr:hypothetical protein [Novosphingobium album (ex Hu et al. 2023)]MCJ2177599.1 hypothetical protein [Novosphingobium album (ex Hu et al. 2023)]